MEKYEEDGMVAILCSPGYGAGWSTWNDKKLAYDKKVVEYYFKHCDDLKSLTKEKLDKDFSAMGYQDLYFGGFSNIIVEWIPKGKKYRIVEYDGSEAIKFEEDEEWETA